jgi:hypothetical protein
MNNLHVREFGIWNSGKTLLCHSYFTWNKESGINIANLKMKRNTESGIRNRESGTRKQNRNFNFNPNKNNAFYHLIEMEFGTQKHKITDK